MSTVSVPCHYLSLHALISSPVAPWDTYNESNTEQGWCQWNRPQGPAGSVTDALTRTRDEHATSSDFQMGDSGVGKHANSHLHRPAASLQIHNWLGIKALDPRPLRVAWGSPRSWGCATAKRRTNSKLRRALRPTRRCSLMSRGHGRSLECAVQLSSMMGHGERRTSGTGGQGRVAPPPPTPHSYTFQFFSFFSTQERLSFDLQLELSAVPLQINRRSRITPTVSTVGLYRLCRIIGWSESGLEVKVGCMFRTSPFPVCLYLSFISHCQTDRQTDGLPGTGNRVIV